MIYHFLRNNHQDSRPINFCLISAFTLTDLHDNYISRFKKENKY